MHRDEWVDQLRGAVSKGIITSAQFDRLEAYLQAQSSSRKGSAGGSPLREAPKSFNVIMVAYYFGALLVLSAFGWFLGRQWDALGPGGILTVSGVYAALFVGAGRYLHTREQAPVAAGLLFTCAVGMTPLMVYALEALTGIWPIRDPGYFHGYFVWINGSWIIIELATVAVAFLALRTIRFSFLVMPAAIALWFLSMDLAEMLFQRELPWELRSQVSVVSGLIFLAAGRGLEKQADGVDYPFWVYLAGLLAFWGGLSSMPSHGELGKAVYGLINVGLIGAGLYLNRKTFAVFGVAGVFGYIGHLAWVVFKDSPLFPLVLATIGLLMILGAVQVQKQYQRVHHWLHGGA